MSKLTLLFLLAVFSCGCFKKEHSYFDIRDLKKITINHPGNDSTIYLSKYIKSVEIIPLEFTEQCILSTVKKVRIVDGFLYILDDSNTDGIYKFNKAGKFITKIGKAGRGPSEHVNLTDFSIDNSSNHLFIYDNAQRKVIEYDLDGRYVKEILVKFPANNFSVKNDLFYFYRMNPAVNEKYSLIIKNKKGNTIKRYFKSNPGNASFISNAFSGLDKDESLVCMPMNDTIYTLRKDTLTYKFHIDFGKYSMSQSDRNICLKNPDEAYKVTQNRIGQISDFYAFKTLLFFSYALKKIKNYAFYNMETGSAETSYSIYDDLTYLFFSAPISQTEGGLIGVYNMSEVNENIRFIENELKINRRSIRPAEKRLDVLKKINKTEIERMNPLVLIYNISK